MSIALILLLNMLTIIYAEAGNSSITNAHWDPAPYRDLVFTVKDPDGVDSIAIWSQLGDSIANVDADCETEVVVRIKSGTGLTTTDFPLKVEITDCQEPAATDTRKVKDPRKGGGIALAVDKLGLLAPYIGLVLTIAVATVITTVYIKRGKHRNN